VIEKLRVRGGHSRRWAAEREQINNNSTNNILAMFLAFVLGRFFVLL
jgi:hypothetical protein